MLTNLHFHCVTENIIKKCLVRIDISEYFQVLGNFEQETYTETDEPFPVPNIPENRMPTP